MAKLDIGIDLGTTSVIIYIYGKGIVLREPSVIAYNVHTKEIVAVGTEAREMLGKAPDYINVVKPLENGVISDFDAAIEMLKIFVKRVTRSFLFKPRIAVCIPSAVTDVEQRAIINATILTGARKVFLIQEPVAAAIGAGLDISQAKGYMVVDIGGGTTDMAVISMNGLVNSSSVKVAGNYLDEAIVNFFYKNYKVVIGEMTAEKIKREVGNLFNPNDEKAFVLKGRSILTGMPVKGNVSQKDLYAVLSKAAAKIAEEIRSLLERTPPELAGDIFRNGILLTGGGAMLKGLDSFLSDYLGVPVKLPENPLDCVAIGTGMSFDYIDILQDGFVTPSMYKM